MQKGSSLYQILDASTFLHRLKQFVKIMYNTLSPELESASTNYRVSETSQLHTGQITDDIECVHPGQEAGEVEHRQKER